MQLKGILETALYVDDLDRAHDFYDRLFALAVLYQDDRLRALRVGEGQVLLLFRRGASLEGAHTEGGFIPPHDGHGPLHMAFHVTEEELPRWEAHLKACGVEVISRLTLNRGHSIYFHDPDGHVVELGTPGLWQK